ncbi:hypothetical protein BDY19DRAFT_917898 [Irpex rosettiformis]|uniref:Uncharacterized protein n=1 Tax=Irpex rosettiformis TaxID=378272 RepID=A0ACB8UHF3_9APHY|nr:hypothetical protein BDY19DRAFT_917898 [Irpex rosettiformis]
MNGSSSSNAFSASSKLGDLFASLAVASNQQWSEIAATAQSLANDLRIKNVEQQTALGKTLLPQTLTSLLKGAAQGSAIPGPDQKAAVFELLRVAANLCVDHDENRNALDEAGFPQTVVALLEAYAESISPEQTAPMSISIPDLKVVRTAIGVLLNASMNYAPVKRRLVSLEAAMTILKLSISIYPPGSWLHPQKQAEGAPEPHTEESWTLRTSLSDWAWRAISELRDEDEDSSLENLFSQKSLPYLVRSLQVSIPPYPSPPPGLSPSLIQTLLAADEEALQESCGLLEALCIDVEDVRLSLARGMTNPADPNGVPCLADMLAFIEHGAPLRLPSSDASEREKKEKTIGRCKAAVINTVTEVTGDKKNVDVLWDDSDPKQPGGKFVQRMLGWIKGSKDAVVSKGEGARDDLVICASVAVGNVARKDSHSVALCNPPISLLSDLAAFLDPEVDIKVKNGVIGLLKNLAVASPNRKLLGEAGMLQKLASSEIWSDKYDMVELVQVAAIGIAKHICNANPLNSVSLVIPDNAAPLQPTALSQILALVRRSDTVAIKSEGTRVFVNAIKSIWSTEAANISDTTFQRQRKEAMLQLTTPSIAAVLAQLIGRSKRYAILISEGAVSLYLLSLSSNGAVIVLDALMNPLPVEISQKNSSSNPLSQPLSAIPTNDSPAVTTPRRALDMLVWALKNSDTPPEVRANIATLAGHLGRQGVVDSSRARDVQVLKDEVKGVLERIVKAQEKGEDAVEDEEESEEKVTGALLSAAKRALDAWGI